LQQRLIEEGEPNSGVEDLSALVAPYRPHMSLRDLSVELNKIYHAYEAETFDRRHPEITEQAPQYWAMMMDVAAAQRPGPWSILDFGCGTGFEAEQLLRSPHYSEIVNLTCYDPSPEMLRKCRGRIAPLFPSARFTSDLAELLSSGQLIFNMLCTNAILHHLHDVPGTIGTLQPILSPDALWLMGHEPSARYFRNPATMRALEAYERENSWRRFLQPRRYIQRLRRLINPSSIPAICTAREAVRRRLFETEPPPSVILHIVDIGSPFSAAEALAGRGLDLDAMHAVLGGSWKLAWKVSYSFMGTFYEGSLPRRWRRVCRELQASYPDDGAQCSAVWQRTS
jgi:SAM-dependent methyltransferase